VIEHLQASREARHEERIANSKRGFLTCIGLGPKPSKKLAARRTRMMEIRRLIEQDDFKDPYSREGG
jgi:hypothetical protein